MKEIIEYFVSGTYRYNGMDIYCFSGIYPVTLTEENISGSEIYAAVRHKLLDDYRNKITGEGNPDNLFLDDIKIHLVAFNKVL